MPPHTVRVFGPGQMCLDAPAGAVVLVRHSGFVPAGIRTVERIRVPREFCWTNHACVTLNEGPNAHVVQETAKGAVLTPLAALHAETFALVTFEASPEQLEAGLHFLAWSLGLGYGWAQLPADAFNAVTGLELGLGVGNRMVCSTQTAEFTKYLGAIYDRPSSAVTPAHIAWYTGAVPKGILLP